MSISAEAYDPLDITTQKARSPIRSTSTSCWTSSRILSAIFIRCEGLCSSMPRLTSCDDGRPRGARGGKEDRTTVSQLVGNTIFKYYRVELTSSFGRSCRIGVIMSRMQSVQREGLFGVDWALI